MECIDERDGCEDDVSEDWEKRSTSRDDLSDEDGWECDEDTTRCDDVRADMGGSAGSGFDGAGNGLLVPGIYDAVDVVDELRLWLVWPLPMDSRVPGCGYAYAAVLLALEGRLGR